MRKSLLLLTALGLAACQDSEESPMGVDGGAPLGTHDATITPATGTDGSTPSLPQSDGAVAPSTGLPCTVKAAVDTKCAGCHADVPQFGAPMSLTRWSDFQAVSARANKPTFQVAAERMTRSGEGMMPPSHAPQLASEERLALDAWFERGAPASDERCGTLDAGVGSDAGGETANTDCELGFELRAGAGAGFPVPMADDHYECFYFKAEVDAKALVTSLSPLIDDSRVLHHWLLFGASQEEAPSGTHRPCDGIHPNAYIMAAWAPGTPALELPPDVGMELPSGPKAQFILETHYNNIARIPGAVDKSGVKVCATAKPKSTLAGIHWLGSERIYLQPRAAGSASSTCTPSGTDPIHLLGVMPHMHTLGNRVKMTILRKNGTSETFHEGPFEFSNQAWYKKDAVLQPGDRIQSTCGYMNTTNATVTLGESTSNEMCYLFTLAYPVGRMNTGGDYRDPFGQPYIKGPNRCMR